MRGAVLKIIPDHTRARSERGTEGRTVVGHPIADGAEVADVATHIKGAGSD